MVGIIGDAESTPTKAKTPFMLYVDSQETKRKYKELREEYAKMSLDQKYEWIRKAVELAPDNVEEILNKEEERIHKGHMKPTPSAYQLYVKETYNEFKQEINHPSEIFSEISQHWKKLDESEKEKYIEAAAVVSDCHYDH